MESAENPRPRRLRVRQFIWPVFLFYTIATLAINLSDARQQRDANTLRLDAQISTLKGILERGLQQGTYDEETVERELEMVGLRKRALDKPEATLKLHSISWKDVFRAAGKPSSGSLPLPACKPHLLHFAFHLIVSINQRIFRIMHQIALERLHLLPLMSTGQVYSPIRRQRKAILSPNYTNLYSVKEWLQKAAKSAFGPVFLQLHFIPAVRHFILVCDASTHELFHLARESVLQYEGGFRYIVSLHVGCAKIGIAKIDIILCRSRFAD